LEVLKVDALNHATMVNVEAGNHPDRQAHQIRAAWIAETKIARAPRA
jgi:hypothetical protein